MRHTGRQMLEHIVMGYVQNGKVACGVEQGREGMWKDRVAFPSVTPTGVYLVLKELFQL